MKIVNFGSLNLDYVYQVPHFPAPGETLAALDQRVVPGGKGLNQSVALARAGASVWHAGAIGQGGGMLKELLADNGVDTSLLRQVDALQGNAVIQVNGQTGENCILLYGGSNQAITREQVRDTLAGFGAGDMLVLQNEVSCLADMIDMAAGRGMRIVLNPSPYHESLSALPFEALEWIFINEVEGAQITGESDPDGMLAAIRRRWRKLNTVLTLGGGGSICAAGDERVFQPIYRVPVVDTTAAGDTFTGYFLAALTQGEPLARCMRRAAAAAAISVSRMGASVSIPGSAEVERMLAEARA